MLETKFESGTSFLQGLGLHTAHFLDVERVVEKKKIFSSNISNLVTGGLQIKPTKDIGKRKKNKVNLSMKCAYRGN